MSLLLTDLICRLSKPLRYAVIIGNNFGKEENILSYLIFIYFDRKNVIIWRYPTSPVNNSTRIGRNCQRHKRQCPKVNRKRNLFPVKKRWMYTSKLG